MRLIVPAAIVAMGNHTAVKGGAIVLYCKLTTNCLMGSRKIRRNMEPEKMEYWRYPGRETWRIQV